MAEADLDTVIRSVAKQQIRSLAAAARKRHGRLMGQAARAKDKEAKARLRELAGHTLELAAAAARRVEVAADNAADSYARAIKRLVEEQAVAKARAASEQAAHGKAAKDKAAATKAKAAKKKPGKKT